MDHRIHTLVDLWCLLEGLSFGISRKASSSRSVHKTIGTECAKEIYFGSVLYRTTSTVCTDESVSNMKKMTLGNGYLGSRIDEERSEMRYLV